MHGISRRRVVRTSLAALFGLAASGGAARAQQDLLKKGAEGLGGLLGGGGGSALSEARIGQGLKEALKMASETVVRRVGRPGGYLEDQTIRIALPGYLQTARSVLGTVGADGLLEDLELRLNRAAERAAPHAERIFLDAIGEITLADAREILNGADDAATRYFQGAMTPELRSTFRPVIDRELETAGAIRAFEAVSEQYDALPFAPALGRDARVRLTDHALDGALSGIFHYLAQEEAAIRRDPAKRTTDLLREVFG